MAAFNRAILMGNLTRDVELRYIPSGTAVAEIGLALNERRKGNDGEWIQETTFVEVTLWGRNAEVASEYCSTGSPVLIEGRLRTDTWEKDGKRYTRLKVVADRLQLLAAPSRRAEPSDVGQQQQTSPPAVDESDIPF